MAQIKIVLTEPLIDGMDVKFQAPCDCTAVTGLLVSYVGEDDTTAQQSFVFKDSHGNVLTGLSNLFVKGAYIKVILDTINGVAYLQNADTNAYLESQLEAKAPVSHVGNKNNPHGVTCKQIGASVVGHNHANEEIKPIAIELNPPSGQNHGGYIDFHFNGSTGDYTTRVIEQTSGELLLNGNKILTKGDIVDKYNLLLSFKDGVATYKSSLIKPLSVVMVQRRGNVAGANMSFCTQTQDGVLTVTTDSNVTGDIYVNLIISYL